MHERDIGNKGHRTDGTADHRETPEEVLLSEIKGETGDRIREWCENTVCDRGPFTWAILYILCWFGEGAITIVGLLQNVFRQQDAELELLKDLFRVTLIGVAYSPFTVVWEATIVRDVGHVEFLANTMGGAPMIFFQTVHYVPLAILLVWQIVRLCSYIKAEWSSQM